MNAADRPARPVPLTDRQAFWSVAVGIPVLISILRLWVEAGGDLQTTLLLVANVGPVNLVAALVVSAAWLVSGALVGAYALGSVTRHAGVIPALDPVTGRRTGHTHWFLWAKRLSDVTSPWLKAVVFVAAALTWPLLFVPLLVLAAVAAFAPDEPRRRADTRAGRWRQAAPWLAAVAAYLVIFGPTLVAAVLAGYLLPVLFIAGPPLLAWMGAAEPVPPPAATGFARLTHAVAGALLVAALVPVLVTPILPLSVVTTDSPTTKYVRGNVVEVTDTTTAILRDQGGVEFVPNDTIRSRVLCPDRGAAPRYRLWVHGVHIEDSLLQGLGRAHRPIQLIDPRCRQDTTPPAD